MSFIRTEMTYPNEECGICLDSLTNDVWEHRKIHRFHGKCITDWVKDKPTCPICREAVDATSLIGTDVILTSTAIPRAIYNTFLIFCVSSLSVHATLILSASRDASHLRNVLFYFEITCLAVALVVKKFFISPQ